MKTILKYVLINGLRDRLYLGLSVSIVIALVVSIFLGSTMLVEQNQSSAIFILSTFRTLLSCGMVLFVCINVARAFENKEIEFILSKSISREKFILAYLMGFFIANLLILAPVSFLIFLIFSLNKFGLLLWFLTTLFENIIVITFALLGSLILKNSFSAILASIGFYAISRLMGMFVMAINLPNQEISAQELSAKQSGIEIFLKILSVAFPRLDLFSQSSWVIYGMNDSSIIKIIFLQSLIYIPLMVFMAFHDFKKKQF